jgi:hypothetical protein
VARIGVGYDTIDVPALTRRRVPLMLAGTANSSSVAEHALFLMLTLAKRGGELDVLVRAENSCATCGRRTRGRARRSTERRVFSSAISVLGKSTTIRSGVGFSDDIGHLRCGIVFFLGPCLRKRLILLDRDRRGMIVGALRPLAGDLRQEAAGDMIHEQQLGGGPSVRSSSDPASLLNPTTSAARRLRVSGSPPWQSLHRTPD